MITQNLYRTGILFAIWMVSSMAWAQGPVSFSVVSEGASSCFQNDGSLVVTASGGVVGEMGMGTVGTDCAEGLTQAMDQMAHNVYALTLINPEAYCSHSHAEGDTFSYMIDVYNPDTDTWTEVFSVTTGTDCYYFPEHIEFTPQSAISAIRFRSSPDTNCGMHVQGLNYRFEAYGYQYSIDGGATWSTSNAFTGLTPGTYQVKVKDGVGTQSLTQMTIVSQAPETSVDAGDDLYIAVGDSIGLSTSVNNLGEVLYGASAPPEDFCLFDADGGNTDCSAFGTSICTEGYIWQYNDASQSASVSSAELASVESLKLSVFYSCGDYSQPDGYNKWDLYVNGTMVGTTGETSSQGCTCEAAGFGTFPKEFVFDDFGLINSIWQVGGENTVEVVYNSRYNTGIALSAYKLQVTYGGIQTYDWTPSESLTASNIANPKAFPTNSTEYTILYTDKYGCQDTDVVKVNVLPSGPGPGPGPGPAPAPTPDLFNVKTKDITVALEADGTLEITPDLVDNGSTAIAGIANRSIGITSFDCGTLGDFDLYLVIEDEVGRKDSAAATVTVVDDLAPVITLVGDVTIQHERYTDYSEAGATDTDNCSSTMTAEGSVDTTTPGVYQITYTATDPSGNTTTATRSVEVVDDEDDDNDGIPDNIDDYILDPTNNGAPSILSFVWDDMDGDGIQDEGEPGIQGVTVELLDKKSKTLATKQSSEDGLVVFFDLSVGSVHRLRFVRPDDYGFGQIDAGADDTKDSDAYHKTDKFTVVDGINDTWDIAYTSPGLVRSFVWDDLNGNGLQDEGEPGIEGINVVLLGSDYRVISSINTDGEGIALLQDAPADEKFRLQFLKPDGYAFTRRGVGKNDSKDSDPKSKTGFTKSFKVRKGKQEFLQIDAGLWSPGVVETFVWDDLDGNGMQDAGEPGIENIVVNVLNRDGETILQGASDADGIASIGNIPADQRLRLSIDVPENYSITYRKRGSSEVNSDVRRRDLTTGWFGAKGGNETFELLDAGLWSPGSIESFVWDDLNGDGIQDAGEPGLQNVPVQLLDRGGNQLRLGLTDAGGIVTFVNVPAAEKLRLQFPHLDDHQFTHRRKGGDNALDSDVARGSGKSKYIFLTGGGTLKDAIDAGVWTPGTVYSYVWQDFNSDGIQDVGEPGKSGVTVHLLNSDDVTITTAVTNAMGIAELSGAPADEKFRLQFEIAEDDEFTLLMEGGDPEKDNDARPSGMTRKFRASMGAQVYMDIDAGIKVTGVQPMQEGDIINIENPISSSPPPNRGDQSNAIDVINLENPISTSPPPRGFKSGNSFSRTESLPEIEELTMEIYPNPVTERLFVQIANPVEEDMQLSLIDLSGRVIVEKQLHFEVGVNQVEIDFGIIKINEGKFVLRLQSPSRGQLIEQLIKY